MTDYFCIKCAEDRIGLAAAEEARRSAANAPRLSPEQVAFFRAAFESARALQFRTDGGKSRSCETCALGRAAKES